MNLQQGFDVVLTESPPGSASRKRSMDMGYAVLRDDDSHPFELDSSVQSSLRNAASHKENMKITERYTHTRRRSIFLLAVGEERLD
jgi:hypothetical protein